MASYPRPTSARERSLNFSLRDKKRGKRTNPPGQHGDKKRRISPFLVALQEKQRIRFTYNLRENQLSNLFIKLRKKNRSEEILKVCETFLVNVLFASKWFKSRLHARQQIAHGHIKVISTVVKDEQEITKVERVKSPSYQLKPGQVISFWKKELADNTFIKSNLEKNEKTPSYLAVDKQKLTITYLREPVEGEVEKKLIEFYSRKKAK